MKFKVKYDDHSRKCIWKCLQIGGYFVTASMCFNVYFLWVVLWSYSFLLPKRDSTNSVTVTDDLIIFWQHSSIGVVSVAYYSISPFQSSVYIWQICAVILLPVNRVKILRNRFWVVVGFEGSHRFSWTAIEHTCVNWKGHIPTILIGYHNARGPPLWGNCFINISSFAFSNIIAIIHYLISKWG